MIVEVVVVVDSRDCVVFFFQAEDGIRDAQESRGLGDVYKRQPYLLLKSWDINALGAGDETATSLGVNVEKTRVISMMAVSIITASILCFTGTIGFIGLVSPHITRMVIGGDHRFLLPASALVGAILLLGADTLARTILAPVILPVGIMTAFLGVPFFVYLFMRRKKEFW